MYQVTLRTQRLLVTLIALVECWVLNLVDNGEEEEGGGAGGGVKIAKRQNIDYVICEQPLNYLIHIRDRSHIT